MHSGTTPARARAAQALLLMLLAAGQCGAAEQLMSSDSAPVAPACALAIADDSKVSALADYRGQVVYVDFWASWCGPCRQSFPFMNDLQSELGAQGLAVVALNLDEEPADAAGFLAKYAASFKIAGGANQACAQAFQVEAMPSSYLIDRAGKVRYIHHGFRAGDAEQLRALATTLLSEPAP